MWEIAIIVYFQLYKVLSYLCLQNKGMCCRILLSLCEQASQIGHNLLRSANTYKLNIDLKCEKSEQNLLLETLNHCHWQF